MKKKWTFVFSFIFLSHPFLAFADQLTLSTYYPSPVGAYQMLRLPPSPAQALPCENGTLYVEDANNIMQFCTDFGGGTARWVDAIQVPFADMDLDGVTTITDVEIIDKLLLGYTLDDFDGNAIPDSRGDVDGDGDLDGTDRTTVFNTVLGAYVNQPQFRKGYFAAEDPAGFPAIAVGGNYPSVVIGNFGQAWGSFTVPDESLIIEGKLGVGTTWPSYNVDIRNNDGANARIYTSNDEAALYLQADDTSFDTVIRFGDGDDSAVGRIIYRNSDNSMKFFTNNSEQMTIQADGNVGIGTTSPGEKLEVNGFVMADAYVYSSDQSLKENIEPLTDSIDKILELEGKSFFWKESGEGDIGLIAQDVEEVFPELVVTHPESGLKALKYGNLLAPLVEAIKEQQKQIEALQAEIGNCRVSEE